jgi:hypothetical protein
MLSSFFTFILYHSSHARQAFWCLTRLAPYTLYTVASNVLCRLALVLEIGSLIEMTRQASYPEEREVRPWCARRSRQSCSARNGNVR